MNCINCSKAIYWDNDRTSWAHVEDSRNCCTSGFSGFFKGVAEPKIVSSVKYDPEIDTRDRKELAKAYFVRQEKIQELEQAYRKLVPVEGKLDRKQVELFTDIDWFTYIAFRTYMFYNKYSVRGALGIAIENAKWNIENTTRERRVNRFS